MIRRIYIIYGNDESENGCLENLLRCGFFGGADVHVFHNVKVERKYDFHFFCRDFEIRLLIEENNKHINRTGHDDYPVIFTKLDYDYAKRLGIALQRRYSNPKGEKIPVSLMHITALVDDLQ